MFNWPNRVWEMGDVSPEGKQLWYSRAPTREDVERRKAVERAWQKRRQERLS